MALVDVYCSRCESWHEDEISEEEITACTMDGNPVERTCNPCQQAIDLEFDMKYPHIGCCGSRDGR